jgi:predicted transcriptional regulator
MAVDDTTSVTLLIPTELDERVKRVAKTNERKRSQEIRIAIREYVERHEANQEKAA